MGVIYLQDLDDALHLKQLGDGNCAQWNILCCVPRYARVTCTCIMLYYNYCAGLYEVGVHIADVSYFIEPGSALDHEASQRATSVYLVQKVLVILHDILVIRQAPLLAGYSYVTSFVM